MRRRKLIGWSTLLMLLLSSSPAGACGDKLLVLGPGARFQVERSDYPGAILLFMNPDVPGSESWKDSQFKEIMEKAGNRWRSVRSREELATALKVDRWDIVLADFADAPKLEELVKTASSQTVILPWVFEEQGADKAVLKKKRAAAKQRYSFIVEGPAKVTKVLSLVERTMEEKPKLLARFRASPTTKPV